MAPGLKDRMLMSGSFHARWPNSSFYGESLLSVFLRGAINHFTMLQLSGYAERDELRSQGYPFPIRENCEFISTYFIFLLYSAEHLTARSSTLQPLNLYYCGQSAGVWLTVLKMNLMKIS